MPIRTGAYGSYIVPTHRWYIERTVWLIAGMILVSSTALALLVGPLWILGVTTTGLVSINVALTGFCPVGNVLRLFGFTPMLGVATPKRRGLYFMQIDRWYLERRIYLAVGINISVASILVLAVSPWFTLFTLFVGGAMVWFAATGYCIMANPVVARARVPPPPPPPPRGSIQKPCRRADAPIAPWRLCASAILAQHLRDRFAFARPSLQHI
jgi:hypothetical protein